MPIVDAVNIAEQYQRVCLHHLGDEAAEFVVIGKHQLGDADGVVLIDDRQHVVLKHHGHTSTLVTVLLAWLEVLLHRQHLAHVYVVLTEQVIVETNKFYLTESRVQLSLFHGVQLMLHFQFPTSASHST